MRASSSGGAAATSAGTASDGCGASRGGISPLGVGAGSTACGPAAPGCASSASARAASSSVLRNSAASGPSRMLARLPDAMSENLLREVAIGLGGRAVRVVLQYRHALDRRLGEAHGLLDPGREEAIA